MIPWLIIRYLSEWNYMKGFNHMHSKFFLYISYLEHIKLDHNLIHALIEKWRCETHTFHIRHGEMTPTLQDVTVFLGLPIYRWTVISISVRNWIELRKHAFWLAPLSSKLKGGSILFKWIEKIFTIPPDDANDEVL
jgi:hypothetical protein